MNVYIYSSEWQPGDNTLLYVPMQSDFKDHGPLNISITNNNSVSLANGVGGARIPVGNFGDGNSAKYLSLSNSVNMQSAYTVLARAYYNAYSSSYGSYLFVQGTNDDNKGLHCGVGITSESRGLLMAFYGNDLDTNQFPTTGVRHHFVFSYDGNGAKKIYQDGVLKASGSGSQFTGTLYTAMIGSRPWQTAARVNGYISNFIIEDKVWTQEEIQNYFNNTKSLYGVS